MWKYLLVCNGEYDNDEQGFAGSLRAAYELGKEMSDPVFVDVSIDYYEYVVIYDKGTMPEDTKWSVLIQSDGEGEHSM